MKKIIFIFLIILTNLSSQDKYDRNLFGEGWNTYKGCITTREHILIIKTRDIITLDSKNCTILSGEWYSIWEDKYFSNPSDIDIDHTVPLKWAYDHGADKWTKKQKNSYANNYVDENHLVPLSIKMNRSKGSKGPDKWMPPFNKCLYITSFIKIINKYQLKISDIENNSYNNILKKECKK